MDPLNFPKRSRSAKEQTEDTPLFAPPADPVPDIRSPAPSAPGSEPSARAARAADRFRKGQNYQVMLTLAALDRGAVLSREEISERTGIKESSLCGRLSDLAPLWVEPVEDACKAKSGVTVTGYRITELGRQRLRERGAA